MTFTNFSMNLCGSNKDAKMTLTRYTENPFLENMTIPVKGQSVRLSILGKDDDILINQGTGEVHSTHVTTYKKVDTDQFVKLFTANIGLTFNLNSAGIKAFNVLLWAVQHKALGKDMIPLDSYLREEFLNAKKEIKLSQATLKRGVLQLEKNSIIARALRQGWYYINPNFCFNGNRIAFTTVIEKEKKEHNVLANAQ